MLIIYLTPLMTTETMLVDYKDGYLKMQGGFQ